MAFKKLSGIVASFLRFDPKNNGPAFKNNGGVLEIRNFNDSGFRVVRGATPQGPNDFVTLSFAQTLEKPIIIRDQADTSVSLPNNTGVERFLVVSTGGSGASIGDLLKDDGTSTGQMSIVGSVEGRTIAVTDALSGGSAEFDPDSIYIWDEDGGSWLKIGDIGSVTGAERVIRFPINNTATQDSAAAIPANARVTEVSIDITTPYSAGATINVGNTTTADLVYDQDDIDPVIGAFKWVDDSLDVAWGGSASVVRVTVGGTPGAGAGVVVVKYTVPNA